MTYLLIFFTSLIFTIFLTSLLISFLRKYNIVDRTGTRKNHSETMPSMGGIIIFLVVLVMINAFVEDFNSIKILIVSAAILIFSGIVEDVLGLNNFIKFIVQNISTILLIYFLRQYYSEVSLFGYLFVSPFDYFILLILIVGTVNSINLLDEINGLASGFSAIIFSILFALALKKNDVFLIILNVSLLGSTLGFLKYNAFPPRVFLGYTGSLTLGFFLIVSSFLTSVNYHNTVLDLTFPLILLGIPLIETAKTLIIRIIKKQNPFGRDTNHQYRITQTSIIAREANVFIIQLFSMAFIFFSILYLIKYRLVAIVLFFIFSALLLLRDSQFAKINFIRKILSILKKIHNFPIRNIFKIINAILILAAVLIVVLAILSFTFTTSLDIDEIYFLFLMVLGLMGVALFRKNRLGVIGKTNVFLNFSIFFIVSKLSLPSVFSEQIPLSTIYKTYEYIFYLLTALIILILVLRWKAFMDRNMFFSSTDLSLIIFILLTFMVNSILQFDLNYYLSISLLEAFIFYVWFKLVVDIKKEFELPLTIASFALPLLMLLILIVASQV